MNEKPSHQDKLNELLLEYQKNLSELEAAANLLLSEIKKVKALIKDVEKVKEKHSVASAEVKEVRTETNKSVHYGGHKDI